MQYVKKMLSAGMFLPLGMMLAATMPANADERVCRGKIGRATVEDVRVPKGARCELAGTRVRGNVKVEAGAALVTRRAVVIGNVQGEGHRSIEVLRDSRIRGDLQAKNGGRLTVVDADVDGNLQVEENRGRVRLVDVDVDGDLQITKSRGSFTLVDNDVEGNLQVFENTGGILIRANDVDQDLQCKENSPAPRGSRNDVDGSKEDQCARL